MSSSTPLLENVLNAIRAKTMFLTEFKEVWPALQDYPFSNRDNPLLVAVQAGNPELTAFLVPFFDDTDTHNAFEISASRGNLAVLKVFVGWVDPNGNNGMALQWAMANKNYPMIDFLLQLVHPKDALDMMKPAWGNTTQWLYVNDFMTSRISARALHAAVVPHLHGEKQRKI